MTSKRKQQTVQFLFEASPENNITRCLISSTTSNTFENGEEWGRGNDRPAKCAADKITNFKESTTNTIGNNKETNGLQRSSVRQGPNIIKESDGDYTRTHDEYGKSHTEKEILQELSESSSDSDEDNIMINGIPGPISHSTIEASSLKNSDDQNMQQEKACFPEDVYHPNHYQSPKSDGQDIYQSKTTINASPAYKNHHNFHNAIQRSPVSNPNDNEREEQFPAVGGSNHNKATHEITKLSFNVGGRNNECEVINNSNPIFYDDNESKYLHVIDNDMQDGVSVIANYDNSDCKNGCTTDVGDKTSDGFNGVYNAFRTKGEKNEKNFPQDYNPERQLSAQGNPRRLEGKQTKLHVNMTGRKSTENIKLECDLHGKTRPENKVKSLVHDYEQQVREKLSESKLETKHEDQPGSVSNANTTRSPYKKRSGVLHNKHVQSLDITAMEQEDLINASPSNTNNIDDGRHHSTKQCDILASNSGKHELAIENNNHMKALQSQKTPSEVNVDKNIYATKVDGDVHVTTEEGNTSSTLDSNREKLSLNGRSVDGDCLPKVGKNHPTLSSNHYLQLEPEEVKSNDQLQTFADGSHVTRAHWYDIQSPLQQPSIPKDEHISTQSPSRTKDTLNPPRSMAVKESNGNDGRQKRWKSLGELNTVDQVEEYTLPEKLNKTVAYPNDEQTMFDGNNNFDTTYFRTIPRSHELKSIPRTHANQRLNLGSDGIANVPFEYKALHQLLPSPSANHTVAKMHNDIPDSDDSSSVDNPAVGTQKSLDIKKAMLSPSLGRRPNTYNASKVQTIGVSNTLTPDYDKAGQSPSLIRKYTPTKHHNNTARKIGSELEMNKDKTLSSYARNFNNSPLLTGKHQKPKGAFQDVNNHYGSLLRVSNYNLSSSLNDLETTERSRSPSRMHKKPSGHLKEINDSTDALHKSYENPAKNLKAYNNNLSSSLTSLETLDQSPMKRSPKMKNLMNIEYYDITSDEELNSKIRRRPRTKSLNEEYKNVESVVPRREFKSSGDLRSAGLNHEEIKVEENTKAKSSAVDLSHASSLRTHGKYTKLYMNSIAHDKHSQEKIPRYSPKSSSSIESISHRKNEDQYERHSQEPLIPNYVTTKDSVLSNRDKHCSTKTQNEKSPVVLNRAIEEDKPKVSHVRTSNTSNLKTVLQQTKRRIKGLSSPLHNSSGNKSKIDNTVKYHGKVVESNTPKAVKKSPVNVSNSATKNGQTTKQHSQDYRETAHRSIVYPAENINANEGKYNVAKAEKEWRKKYGRLPYSNKDPLHQSSDKEFSRLFQNSEKSKLHSSSKVADFTMKNSSIKGKLDESSSSSLFSPDKNKNEGENTSYKNAHAKEFTATLNQLSSYVLSGYKVDNPQTPASNNQEKNTPVSTVKYKRYYLDDEGDLSYILDDLNESPKVSMLVHTIIRLREVYSIEHNIKPQTPEHPINLGNPQMRDAIQNKPMSVVKDLILANKSVDINIRSESGNSALHRAAIEGDIDAIRIMINHGANVNIRDRYGFQPVNQALRCHHYKAAMFLMDCGTDLMSYTSKRIQEFVNVKAIAKQYLRQTLKTPL